MKPNQPEAKFDVFTIGGMYGEPECSIYCAGPGQSGRGRIMFTGYGVVVEPEPAAVWRVGAGGNRKEENKLVDENKQWKTWFLLTRALVLSREALDESERVMAPADSFEEAASDSKAHALAMHRASEARRHAVMQLLMEGYGGEDFDIGIAASNHLFIHWFGGVLADRLSKGDFDFVNAVTGYARAAREMPDDFPRTVREFCKCLRVQAKKAGQPPTKESVRLELGGGKDTFDTDKFKALVSRTGFGWLPQAKPGPQPKFKSR